jgi:hypothetical protein
VNVRHFVPLEGKFLLITLVIVRITLNVRQMPLKFPLNNGVAIVQKLVVKLSNTSVNVISICCENVPSSGTK